VIQMERSLQFLFKAKDSVSADVIFIIASAFGLGNALADSCAANAIAKRCLTFQIVLTFFD
jgi:hypothetical protein